MSNVVQARRDHYTPEAATVSNPYGHFTAEGTEFCITDYRTPRPWINVIANPRIGLTISQTGSGFSWIDNSQLAVITRWQQEFAQDVSGKFLYVRDLQSGQLWSLSPAPTWPKFDQYACHHGIGYTTFETRFAGIEARWTLFVGPEDTIEYWRLELQNTSDRLRRLELCAYLEWNCGVAPAPRREFQKLFLETDFDRGRRAIFAQSHMWEVPGRFGHWNTSFPYVSALGSTEPVLAALADKAAFLGRYGELRAPAALEADVWRPEFGRHGDAIAALRCGVELRPGESRPLGFALVVADSRAAVEKKLENSLSVEAMDQALAAVRAGWQARLAAQRVETPEPSLNYLVNDWVRYQAISGRLWGRAGYYQQSGAYGFRDQLQDSQIWLTIDPQRCREQVRVHAGRQFADGSVYHWWHPLTEQGHVTKMTDDLLWLAFVVANYIRETGDYSILWDEAPFLDEPRPATLLEHVERAFARVFGRFSPRGLPYIGAGDWNDGLSAVGLEERGESIWLGQFLVGLLADWAEIYRRIAAKAGIEGSRDPRIQAGPGQATYLRSSAVDPTAQAHGFEQRRAKLIAAINEHGWDGNWYLCATRDDGTKLGTHTDRVCRVYLNTQTWAILNDVAPPERARQAWQAVREHLVTEAGALLLRPAFDRPIPEVGYITRYAPGLRENGGVYTHAATWAIAAACKMRDRETVGKLLVAINPALKDPERYWAEPYVLPGNVDGPDSPHHGRAGWTWYTGSAQWLHRVVSEWVLGVRPEWDGLRIDPCLPANWTRAAMVRPWRGSSYRVQIEQAAGATAGAMQVCVDGRAVAGGVVAVPGRTGEEHAVLARQA